MDLQNTIRENFERYMNAAGLTIAKIAEAKGVTRQTIYSYFRKRINLVTLEKLADLVGVECWQLLAPPEMINVNKKIKCPKCGEIMQVCINMQLRQNEAQAEESENVLKSGSR